MLSKTSPVGVYEPDAAVVEADRADAAFLVVHVGDGVAVFGAKLQLQRLGMRFTQFEVEVTDVEHSVVQFGWFQRAVRQVVVPGFSSSVNASSLCGSEVKTSTHRGGLLTSEHELSEKERQMTQQPTDISLRDNRGAHELVPSLAFAARYDQQHPGGKDFPDAACPSIPVCSEVKLYCGTQQLNLAMIPHSTEQALQSAAQGARMAIDRPSLSAAAGGSVRRGPGACTLLASVGHVSPRIGTPGSGRPREVSAACRSPREPPTQVRPTCRLKCPPSPPAARFRSSLCP